jgi:hypothetical protein
MNWSACMLLKGWHMTCNNMCTVRLWAAVTRILWMVPWSAVLIQIVLAVSTPSRNPGASSYGAQFQSDAASRELIYSGSLLCSKNAAGWSDVFACNLTHFLEYCSWSCLREAQASRTRDTCRGFRNLSGWIRVTEHEYYGRWQSSPVEPIVQSKELWSLNSFCETMQSCYKRRMILPLSIPRSLPELRVFLNVARVFQRWGGGLGPSLLDLSFLFAQWGSLSIRLLWSHCL